MIRLLILPLFLFMTNTMAEDCRDTAMTQSEITMCSKARAETIDKELNDLENKIELSLELTQRERFVQSQLNWRSMAENDCLIQRSFYEGGSVAPSVYSSCMESRIEKRIEQIKYFLCPSWWMKGDCPEADIY